MGFLDDIAKIALPVVAGSFLGPAAGGLFGGALSLKPSFRTLCFLAVSAC